jgi:hypothetical protein
MQHDEILLDFFTYSFDTEFVECAIFAGELDERASPLSGTVGVCD